MVDTVVILTGGKSSRMGTDKARLKIGDRTFLEETYYKFKPYFNDVLLSLDTKGKYDDLNINAPQIEDIIKNIGPMGGIYSVFKQTDLPAIFAVGVDTPFLSVKAAKAIIKLSNDSDICLLEHSDSKIEPLFGVYKRTCLNAIEELIKEETYSMRKLFSSLKVKTIPQKQLEKKIGEKLDKSFLNLNTKEEYVKYVAKN
jgi:molybdopterin-guanine dinucleotide biosynthesis protein A